MVPLSGWTDSRELCVCDSLTAALAVIAALIGNATQGVPVITVEVIPDEPIKLHSA